MGVGVRASEERQGGESCEEKEAHELSDAWGSGRGKGGSRTRSKTGTGTKTGTKIKTNTWASRSRVNRLAQATLASCS